MCFYQETSSLTKPSQGECQVWFITQRNVHFPIFGLLLAEVDVYIFKCKPFSYRNSMSFFLANDLLLFTLHMP